MRSRVFILYALLGGVAIGLLMWWMIGQSSENLADQAAAITTTTTFHQSPIYVGMMTPAPEDTTLHPFAIHLHEGRVLVSYLSTDRVDEFSERFERIRSIRLLGGEKASITGLAVEGSHLYATDFRGGELLVADYRTGKHLHSFGMLPDKKSRMKLLGVTAYQNNLYVTDASTNQILVIGTAGKPRLKEEWELILHFPSPAARNYQIGFGTYSMITPDGRLIVADAGKKDIKAFTCNGRPAHFFDKGNEASVSAPMGIAMDNLPSPELQAVKDTVFHPSGVYEQGRVHVVDAVLARVKVFSTLGKYVLTYGDELRQPNGIAIDHSRRLIFITDAQLRAIVLYKY